MQDKCHDNYENYYYCRSSRLTSLVGLPKKVTGNFDCSVNLLTSLIGSPNVVEGDYYCHNNKLTSLVGSPKKSEHFDAFNNKLITLEGAPIEIGQSLICDKNDLTSLYGVPKYIKWSLLCRQNPHLKDVSDLWDSIIGNITFELSIGMAILPLVKFNVQNNNDFIEKSINKNRGESKQNLFDFQHDLIENGFAEFARWKPE